MSTKEELVKAVEDARSNWNAAYAIDKDPEGTVWHVNTKHLMTFAQVVADKTRQELLSSTEPTKSHAIEHARLVSQKFRDRNMVFTWDALDREAVQTIDALISCAEGWWFRLNDESNKTKEFDNWRKESDDGADDGGIKCKTHPDAPHSFLRNSSHNEGRYVCECELWEEPKINKENT